MEGNIYVSELSTTKHTFSRYHFCRGNSNKRKSRFGVIVRGEGTYLYLNKKLRVTAGDVVFIPENVYCYSEWHGEPEIEVVYLSCFIHYERFRYEPQVVACTPENKAEILQICEELSRGAMEKLGAYARFYTLLQTLLPQMVQTDVPYDKTLQTAMEYITDHWKDNFSVGDLAKKCCVSESTLYHLFSRELGQTPIGFLNSIKINVAIEYLENTNYSISTISRLVNFHSENHFRKVFYDLTSTTPLKFRKSR